MKLKQKLAGLHKAKKLQHCNQNHQQSEKVTKKKKLGKISVDYRASERLISRIYKEAKKLTITKQAIQ